MSALSRRPVFSRHLQVGEEQGIAPDAWRPWAEEARVEVDGTDQGGCSSTRQVRELLTCVVQPLPDDALIEEEPET